MFLTAAVASSCERSVEMEMLDAAIKLGKHTQCTLAHSGTMSSFQNSLCQLSGEGQHYVTAELQPAWRNLVWIAFCNKQGSIQAVNRLEEAEMHYQPG